MDSQFDFDYFSSDPFYAMTNCEIIRARDQLAWDYSKGLITDLDFAWLLSKSREALVNLVIDAKMQNARLELEDLLDRALSWTVLDSLDS